MQFNSSQLPDPERARKNVETFISENPDLAEKIERDIEKAATLFSYSQFLANYCIQNPAALFRALQDLSSVFNTGRLHSELKALLSSCGSLKDGMKAVRIFKKDKLLVVTLKDILKLAPQQDIMLELSGLADVILDESLGFVEASLRQRFGEPVDNSLVIISLGKLGAEELNYSSDVDIVAVYREDGETAGAETLQGTVINRLSAFEYYSKVVEEYSRFLSANTEDGFCYRVDMRLRPQGQRGSLVLPMRSYEEYYEAWGQLWEKAALLRARPVAGDMELGRNFLEMIKPFVFRKYLDFHAIEELRRMKAQVEQIKPGTQSRDIKRGFGGIREIEFFIQIFQMIYGGREPLLRERGTLKALYMLRQKGFIGYEDFHQLSGNYIYFRTLEHRLQQLNDLQTHSLPSGDKELDVLAAKMGHSGRAGFLADLEARRLKVRRIYDSLLYYEGESGKNGKAARPSSVLDAEFWDIDMPVEHLLSEELSRTGIRDIRKAMHCLMKIRNSIYSFQTIRGRRLLDDIIPQFVNDALKSPIADRVLLQLVDFSEILAVKESYLEAIAQRPEIVSILNFIFANSEYLSKMLMSNPEYIESLVEGQVADKTGRVLAEELNHLIDRYGGSTAVRLFRRMEEVRLGVMFLNGKTSVQWLFRGLSKTAEAVLAAALPADAGRRGLSVVGFGKLGGRELSFNSDLDLIFITEDEPTDEDMRAAERLIKVLMSYTKDGMAYKIDTRLRPEGNKGPLVSSIKGITEYYLRYARGWELQALLKARPINSLRITHHASRSFMEMRRDILLKRGGEVTFSEIKAMRKRIRKELSKDSDAYGSRIYDIKLGAGGLEELEFAIQYLQLRHCGDDPSLLVQSTLDAIKRLGKRGILNVAQAAALSEAYLFYRTVETVLRLRNEGVLKIGGDVARGLADFMGRDMDGFEAALNEQRAVVENFLEALDHH